MIIIYSKRIKKWKVITPDTNGETDQLTTKELITLLKNIEQEVIGNK